MQIKTNKNSLLIFLVQPVGWSASFAVLYEFKSYCMIKSIIYIRFIASFSLINRASCSRRDDYKTKKKTTHTDTQERTMCARIKICSVDGHLVFSQRSTETKNEAGLAIEPIYMCMCVWKANVFLCEFY